MSNGAESMARLLAMATAEVERIRHKHGAVRMLEAGGGAETRVDIDATHITVIDVSAKQLARNTYAHEKIEADLHDVDLGARVFDVIVFWDVLEHLRDPGAVVRRMAASLSEHGLIVIASPNPLSLSGLIVKFTPHAFHDFFHKHLMKTPQGSGYMPFRTYMRLDVRAERMRACLAQCGLQVALMEKYQSTRAARLRRRSPMAGAAHDAVISACKALTFGRWGAELSDYVLLAKRAPEAVRSEAVRPQARAASA